MVKGNSVDVAVVVEVVWFAVDETRFACYHVSRDDSQNLNRHYKKGSP